MAWTSLQNTLSQKPRVLAGPLLRRVTPAAVSVWLALHTDATVTLTIQDDQGNALLRGARATVAVGANLHIVVVTAAPIAGSELQPGIVYGYDLAFTFGDQVTMDLRGATDNAPLTYPQFALPTFCLPSPDPNTLRLLQGSCRIPHGNGQDALELGDFLIAQSADDPLRRPQQLLLTGDQIYADDVAVSMLFMLTDAADALLGWQEVLPVAEKKGGPKTAAQIVPYARKSILDHAGFTSEDLEAHLMSLGEYLCMYLFVWSDVLWPLEADMPAFADVEAAARANLSGEKAIRQWLIDRARGRDRERFGSHAAKMRQFRAAVPQVRRLLANIPSYMIFDDHEVTDDWNMTREFCQNIYGNALGLRVMQNGLVAYVLCQHWGNAPDQFDRFGGAAAEPPGEKVLAMLDGTTAERYAQDSAALRTSVGIHDAAALTENALFHEAGSLLFHYTVEGLAHQIIFTDTRTWRAFPTKKGGGVLLPSVQLQEQIVRTPLLDERALLVVLSTNAPPVQPIRAAARHDTIANLCEHHPDVYEAWEVPAIHFDRLMVALSEKLPLVGGERTGAAMLLSGDVHHSFASRLLYKAKARFEDEQPQPVSAVIAQLVASSYRKQTDSTLGFQREGYDYTPNFIAALMIPGHAREGYAGWNAGLGSGRAVGEKGREAGGAWIPLLTVELDQPTLQIAPDGFFLQIALDRDQPPDYSYTLDYLLPTRDTIPSEQPAPIPALGPGATPQARQHAAAAFRTATRQLRKYNSGVLKVTKVIGVNNLGELSFTWDANDRRKRKVHHSLHWRIGLTDTVQVTDYTVSLDPDDPDFPEIKPRVIP